MNGWKVPSGGHPTWKAGHSAEQKIINLLFLTSKDKLWALALTSKNWSVMRESGVDSPGPMVKEWCTRRERDQRQCQHTHKHGEPKTNTRTDKHRPTTQRWAFGPPEFSCLPVPDGVHCSPDLGSGEELSFPQSQLPSSTLAGLGLEPAGMSSPFPTLHRKLSPMPDTFLLPSRASDLHWTFLSCLSTSAIIYPSPLSWKCSLPPVKGSRTSPDVRIPEQEERRPPRQCNSQKGKFIADSSQGSCRIQCSGVGSESPEPKLLHKFIGWAHTVGSWFKRTGYKFAKQFHWPKPSCTCDFPRGFCPIPNFLIGKQGSVLSKSWLVVSRWSDNLTTQR